MTETTTKVLVGMPAPIFQTTDLFDRPFNLADYRGRWLLLSFYRNAACAICNVRVHTLIGKYDSYHQQGLEMLAIFESPTISLRQYVGKQNAPFPIVGDPEAHLYDLYGIETSMDKVNASMGNAITQQRVQEAAAVGFQLTKEDGSNFYRMPADFLIDPDGVVREAFYSEVVGQHLDLAVVNTHLKAPVA